MVIYSKQKKRLDGFSLVELLVAITIFFMVIGSVAIFALDSLRFVQNDRIRVSSISVINELANAIIINKTDLWTEIINNSDGTPKHILFQDNSYLIEDGPITQDGVELSFTINDLYRDSNREIVTTGGSYDPYSKAIVISASWSDFLGKPQTINSTIYVNNWKIEKFTESTTADFTSGTVTDTYISTHEDGEVELDTIFFPDWCKPTLALNQYDIPGTSTVRSVFARPGYAYLGTRGSTSGDPFSKVTISGVDPPLINLEGTFQGYTVNDIFVVGNYAFLATTNDSKEVVIVDVSSTPYQEVGYFNASGTADGLSVYVSNNIGYMTQGRNLRTFNLSAFTGSRAQLDSVSLGFFLSFSATASQVIVRGSYAYVVLNNDLYELSIVNVQNPSNINTVSQTTVNNQQVLDVYVTEDGSTTFFGTNSSSSEHEFFILNTVNPNNVTVISSVDTNGMSVRGLSVVLEDHVAILGGTGGEEYQVFNITNLASPTKCGGMEISSGIYDIDSGDDLEGNAFSYVITGDTSAEFKLLRGGPGGGNSQGYGYVTNGTYTSSVIDTQSTNTYLFSIDWVEEIQSTTDLRIHVRASNSQSMSGAVWMGPDGTGSTYYTDPSGTFFPSSIAANRYVQYRVYLTSGDKNYTSRLKEINIYYEK